MLLLVLYGRSAAIKEIEELDSQSVNRLDTLPPSLPHP